MAPVTADAAVTAAYHHPLLQCCGSRDQYEWRMCLFYPDMAKSLEVKSEAKSELQCYVCQVPGRESIAVCNTSIYYVYTNMTNMIYLSCM